MKPRPDVLNETLRRVLAALASGEPPRAREARGAPRRRGRAETRARRADPSVEEIERLAAALRRIYERDPEREPAPPHPGYDAARRGFRERAVRLLEQLSFGEALAEETLPALPTTATAAPLVQQEIRLQAPPRGIAAGRFLLTNEGDEPFSVHFEAGVLHGETAAQGPAPCFEAPVHFDPEAPVLEPARARTVRIEVDLADTSTAEGQDLELAVDVLGRDALLARLWVGIAVRGDIAEGGAP